MRKSDRPTVVYWNNLPAPYMVDRFNALMERGNLKFEVWFNDRTVPGRSWRVDETEWLFRYRYVPAITVRGHRIHFPVFLLVSHRPKVLVSLYAAPSFMAGWFLARLLGIKTAFRVLKTHDSWVRRRWIKERLKRWLFARVDGVETPGKDGAAFAMQYGVPAERIFFATHTVDMQALSGHWRTAFGQREEKRREQGLRGVVFLYVGRLWQGKGIFTLLDAYQHLCAASCAETSLLLVGDGQDEHRVREYCVRNALRNVVFSGFRDKAELPKYYAMSDVFVFPTLGDPYGIVVDEAMACRLPVISTSAAGEIAARVKDGITGYMVAPGNSEAMASAMLKMINDEVTRTIMGKHAQTLVANHTPECWAEQFEEMINTLLTEPVKR